MVPDFFNPLAPAVPELQGAVPDGLGQGPAVQNTETFIFETEPIKEPPTEPDELARKWLNKIEAGRKHWEKFYERCKHNRAATENIDWKTEADDIKFCPKRANLLQATITGILPNLYAKNPEISVVPVRSSDADSGRLDRVTKTLEQVLNRYLAQAKLKQRARAAVRAALTCSYGIVKVVYQRDLDADPLIRQRLQDAQDNLRHIDGLLSRLAEDDAGRTELEVRQQELIESIKGLQEDSEAKALDGLVIDRILTDQLIVDPSVVDFEDYVQADWMCQVVPMRRATAEELYKVKLPKATTYEMSLDRVYERAHAGVGPNGDICPEEDDTIVVYEVWDRISQRVYTLADGCAFFLREPYSPARVGGRWYPFFLLPYQQVDGKFVAQSLVDTIEQLEKEHNDTRNAYAEHRSFCKPGYIASADIDERSLNRFCVAELGEITVIKKSDGQDLRSLIQPKTYPPIDSALYDTSLIRQDIEQVTGLQDAMRQSVVKPKTATEAQIMQQGLSARVAAFRDGVEDWLQEIATYTTQILLRELTEEDVARIMGEPVQVVDPATGAVLTQKPYDWPTLTTEQVARLIKIKIAAGSTGAPNRLEDQESWGKLLPVLQQMVQMLYQLKMQGVDTGPIEVLLRETVHRYDDRFDATQLIPDINPQQLAMQQQQQAAASQGPQGGIDPAQAQAILSQLTQQ